MPRVRIEPSGTLLTLTPGARLLDALDAAGSTVIPFGCRDASCSRCVVRVTAGHAGVQAPGPVEQELLDGLGVSQDVRLGCQLVTAATTAADVEVVVRVPGRDRG